LNYSCYYGALAIKTVFDVVRGREKITKKYKIDELDVKTKSLLNRFIIDSRVESYNPITISRLRESDLLNKALKGKIKDKRTIERMWYVLEILESEGPMTLAKLENLVREKSESLGVKKKSWTREMFIVLSRLNIQNLLILYKDDEKIKEVTFPETEDEYSNLVTQDVKIWSRFDF
ncbi:MAG: hypothetical protein N3A69_15285, partial [Leptospiraceae bacterium]|nr:hypothetical protein [Leptospiraceae bacterium]